MQSYSGVINERDLVQYLPTNNNLCSVTPPTPPPSTFTINGSSSRGYCEVPGQLTINGNGQTTHKITIHAGDVYITDDLAFTNNRPGTNPSGFKDEDVPIVLIVADSNIYIDSTVNQIDAILVAKNTIFTCASGFNEVARSNWHSQCNEKLTINGAVGANNIRFARSKGSRLLGPSASKENESDVNNGGNITGSVGANNQAAEVINYPGYLYFATPFLKDNGNAGYQALFSAPPLF